MIVESFLHYEQGAFCEYLPSWKNRTS